MGERVNSTEEKNPKDDMLPFMSSAKVSSMSMEHVIREFRSEMSSGLSNEEAELRKRIYGLNEFDVGEETPLWRKYVDQLESDCMSGLCLAHESIQAVHKLLYKKS